MENVRAEYAVWKRDFFSVKPVTPEEKTYCIKCAIGKTLKEYIGDDLNTSLYSKGYDHVVIPDTVVGMYGKPQTMITETIVLPEAVPDISIVDYDTGLYHYSPEKFKAFDVECIGSGHGASYASGIYLTDTPIEAYGEKMNVDISRLKKPYVLDIYDDEAVIKYIKTCM